MSFVITIALVGIVATLAAAGFFMLRGGKREKKSHANMAHALALRVGVSIALFLFILLSYQLGWIKPTGLPLGH